jgi:hypothetical protein
MNDKCPLHCKYSYCVILLQKDVTKTERGEQLALELLSNYDVKTDPASCELSQSFLGQSPNRSRPCLLGCALNTFLLEKLAVPQLVKKSIAFCVTRRFITVLTTTQLLLYCELDKSRPRQSILFL